MIDRVSEEGEKDGVTKLCNLQCYTDQSTPLMYAAWGGNLKLCQLLVEEGGADPLHTDKQGQNALHWAAAAGHLEVCQYLAGARYRESLLQASTEDEKELVEFLAHGQIMEHDIKGLTPLDYAIQYDHKDVIEWVMNVL